MTTVRADLITGGRVPAGFGTITYTPTQPRQATIDAAKVVLPVDTEAVVTAGIAQEKDLEPGPYLVRISVERFTKSYRIVVPTGGPVQLWSLLEDSIPYEPVVVSLVKGYRDAAEGFATTATGAATAASGSASAALGYRNTASGAALTAAEKATEAEAARANAFLSKQAAELSEANALAYRNTANGAAATAVEKAGEASDSAGDATAKAAEAEEARDEALLAQQGAELARDQTAQGAVPDGGVSTIKLVDGAVTKPKLSAALQSSIDKADASQTEAQVEAIALAIATARIAEITGNAPEALDTVYELAAALGNDPNFRDTVLNAIGLRALLTDPRFTDARSPLGTTQAVWNAGTANAANFGLTPAELRAAVDTAIILKFASPAFTGTPTVAGVAMPLGNDVRLTNTRTPTAGTSPFGQSLKISTGTRAVGFGNVDQWIKVGRAVTISEVFLSFDTKDASGTTTVELFKNDNVSWFSRGVTAATQEAGVAVTGTWNFVKGDEIYAKITSVGTTPGEGLAVHLWGLT